MFQVGDYVTGMDRSYKRSIYQVHEINNDGTFTLKFICLDGRLGTNSDFEYSNRPMHAFRLASVYEVHTELGLALKYNFKAFIEVLLSGKEPYF
jgi:hypothetical protein